MPPRERARAYRDGALPIGSGQTISQPWIVAAHGAGARAATATSACSRWAAGSGYSAAVLSLLCRELVTIERHVALADQAQALLRELGRTNVEVRAGDGTLGAPDRAPFDGDLGDRDGRGRGAARACSSSSRPRGTLVCPVRRAAGEHLVRIRDGEEEVLAAGALRAPGQRRVSEKPPLLREFSAGGLVVRRMRGPPVHRRRAREGRHRAGAAEGPHRARARAGPRRRCARCARRPASTAELVEKLDDIRYWYTRDGARVLKVVSFFLLSYRSGSRARLPARGGRRRRVGAARGGAASGWPTRARSEMARAALSRAGRLR